MTWQKQDYLFPIELLDFLTGYLSNWLFEGMKSYRDSVYNKTEIGELTVWGLFHNSYGIFHEVNWSDFQISKEVSWDKLKSLKN